MCATAVIWSTLTGCGWRQHVIMLLVLRVHHSIRCQVRRGVRPCFCADYTHMSPMTQLMGQGTDINLVPCGAPASS